MVTVFYSFIAFNFRAVALFKFYDCIVLYCNFQDGGAIHMSPRKSHRGF